MDQVIPKAYVDAMAKKMMQRIERKIVDTMRTPDPWWRQRGMVVGSGARYAMMTTADYMRRHPNDKPTVSPNGHYEIPFILKLTLLT